MASVDEDQIIPGSILKYISDKCKDSFDVYHESHLLVHQGPLIAPVRKALNYYTHMGKTMEEELKKQEKKHSREEHQEKIETKVDIIETTEEKQEKMLLKEEQADNNVES